MSDQNQPNEALPPGSTHLPSSPPPAPPPPSPPARSMADVARLFLHGARQVSETGAPKRISPRERQNAVPPAAAPAPSPAGSNAPAHAPVMLALSLPAGDSVTWRLLSSAAAGIAEERGITVALLGIEPGRGGAAEGQFVIDLAGAEYPMDLPAMTTSASPPPADVQIARILNRLRPTVGLWLVAAPDPASIPFAAVSSILREWLLACPTDNDGLVAAYQYFKRAVMKAEEPGETALAAPAVFLVSDDFAHAARVQARLRKAAREFLRCELALAGVGPMRPTATRRLVSLAVPGSQEGAWAGILDELCPANDEEGATVAGNGDASGPRHVDAALDEMSAELATVARTSAAAHEAVDHLAQVLDPEERAALAMGFDEPAAEPLPVVGGQREEAAPMARPEPEMRSVPPDPRAVPAGVTTKQEVVEKTTPACAETFASRVEPAKAPSRVPALRAFDLQEDAAPDRRAQWEAVERSVRDLLPRAVVLEARAPMSWAAQSALALDADGRLHVWTLYRDGVSWFALREWAAEHRSLLALTRRDLYLDVEAEVAVHVVLPLEAEEGGGALLRVPAGKVVVYRLRVVNWSGRQGIVVVPIG